MQKTKQTYIKKKKNQKKNKEKETENVMTATNRRLYPLSQYSKHLRAHVKYYS